MSAPVRVRRVRTDLSALPPRARGDGTRGRILIAALELFAEHGYEGTSIRDVAAASVGGSASLYSHFSSKEAILAELARIGHEEHHACFVAALMDCGPDPHEQLVAIVRAHVRVHCDYPMLCVVANTELHALSGEAVAPVMVLRLQSEQILLDVLRRGQEAGRFDLIHLEATAAAIGAIGMRVAHWYPSPLVDLDANELSDKYAELALRMVVAPATP